MDKRISESTIFNGSIPAFKRLAIIFEKQKDLLRAIEICNIAIDYYENIRMQSCATEFKIRKDKLQSKVK